jgi:hypothetical protein
VQVSPNVIAVMKNHDAAASLQPPPIAMPPVSAENQRHAIASPHQTMCM